MSWWNKNKKKLLGAAGLLGLGATGFGLAGAGPLAGLLGGAGTAAKAGFAGATLAPGLAGPTTAGAGGLMGLGAAAGGAPLPAGAAQAGLLGASMLAPQEQPQQAPMPPPPPAAPPVQSSFAGYGDPMANLTEEQKKQLLAMLEQGRMR